MSTLERAIAIAAEAHTGQTDKGGEPYILHPLRVMMRMETRVERIVAVLHDVLEDCPEWTEARLADHGFGRLVLDALFALTRQDGERYESFIRRLKPSQIARAVKLADLADNMDLSRLGREPTKSDLARQERYRAAVTALSDPLPQGQGEPRAEGEAS